MCRWRVDSPGRIEQLVSRGQLPAKISFKVTLIYPVGPRVFCELFREIWELRRKAQPLRQYLIFDLRTQPVKCVENQLSETDVIFGIEMKQLDDEFSVLVQPLCLAGRFEAKAIG